MMMKTEKMTTLKSMIRWISKILTWRPKKERRTQMTYICKAKLMTTIVALLMPLTKQSKRSLKNYRRSQHQHPPNQRERRFSLTPKTMTVMMIVTTKIKRTFKTSLRRRNPQAKIKIRNRPE